LFGGFVALYREFITGIGETEAKAEGEQISIEGFIGKGRMRKLRSCG